MESVARRLDEVLDASTRLRDIKTRLGELEEERAALESQAERLLEVVAAAASSALAPLKPPASNPEPVVPDRPRPAPLFRFVSGSLTDRIVEFLDANDGVYGATEVAAKLGLTDVSSVNTIRGTLSRLHLEGRIDKAGYGKYRGKKEGKENASHVSA
jgi:hypothetical protein